MHLIYRSKSPSIGIDLIFVVIFPGFVSIPLILPGSLNRLLLVAVLQPGAVIASWCQAVSGSPLNSSAWGG